MTIQAVKTRYRVEVDASWKDFLSKFPEDLAPKVKDIAKLLDYKQDRLLWFFNNWSKDLKLLKPAVEEQLKHMAGMLTNIQQRL